MLVPRSMASLAFECSETEIRSGKFTLPQFARNRMVCEVESVCVPACMCVCACWLENKEKEREVCVSVCVCVCYCLCV